MVTTFVTGYLGQANGQRLQSWFDSDKGQAGYMHTSGHASTTDLKAFAVAMGAEGLMP